MAPGVNATRPPTLGRSGGLSLDPAGCGGSISDSTYGVRRVGFEALCGASPLSVRPLTREMWVFRFERGSRLAVS
jgi:hypothetical protein